MLHPTPASVPNFPASQLLHANRPAASAYVPAMQEVHLANCTPLPSVPVSPNDPVAHSTHAAGSSWATAPPVCLPGPQIWQCACALLGKLASAPPYVPPGQSVQAVSPAAAAYLPRAQLVQAPMYLEKGGPKDHFAINLVLQKIPPSSGRGVGRFAPVGHA